MYVTESLNNDVVILLVRELALIIRWPRYVHNFTDKKQSLANDIKRWTVSLCIYSTRIYNIRPVVSSRRSSAPKKRIYHISKHITLYYILQACGP
jgi:hypothetical protein